MLLLALLPVYALYHIDGVVTGLNCNSLTLVDDYAFVGGGWALKIVDISDPTNPQLLNVNSNLYQGDAVIRDSLAFMIGYTSVRIVNISDPLQPFQVAQIDSLGPVWNIAVSEPYLYVFYENDFMEIFDISDLSNPQFAGSFQMLFSPSTITISGGLMFVSGNISSNNARVQIIDVSVPAAPVLRYSYTCSNPASGITVSGNIAYLAMRYNGMLIWDISNPYQPVHLGVFDPGRAIFDVSIEGSTACLANELNGILMVDLSNPASPVVIGSCDTPDFANRVVLRGNRVYVGSGIGLQVVDVSDPLPSPGYLGSYCAQEQQYASLALANNKLYLVEGFEGLKILDVSEPSQPAVLGEYEDLGATRVQVVGNKAYILNMLGSFDILDVSDPAEPLPLGSYTGLDSPVDAAIVGNSAFVLDQMEGLKILNISNPSSPVLSGSYADLINPYDLAIRGNYAYILDRVASFPKLVVVNKSNPASPQYAGECYLPHDPNSIAIYGSYAYIVSSQGGLGIYQITNSTSVTLLSSFLPHPSSNLVHCLVSGTRLYVSDLNWNELDIFELSNPAQPVLLQQYKMNFGIVDMQLENSLLYTANDFAGMHILDLNQMVGINDPLPEPQSLALSNYPNPFNPRTTIAFSLPDNGKVELDIYNMRGQVVRHLLDENKTKGSHSVIWNGKDDQNRDLASGVYVYRLSCGTRQQSARMILIK